jgi:hypothetical protein
MPLQLKYFRVHANKEPSGNQSSEKKIRLVNTVRACKGSQKGRSSSNAKQTCSSERVSDPQQRQRNQSRRYQEKGYNTISTENLQLPQMQTRIPRKKITLKLLRIFK